MSLVFLSFCFTVMIKPFVIIFDKNFKNKLLEKTVFLLLDTQYSTHAYLLHPRSHQVRSEKNLTQPNLCIYRKEKCLTIPTEMATPTRVTFKLNKSEVRCLCTAKL